MTLPELEAPARLLVPSNTDDTMIVDRMYVCRQEVR